MPGYDPTAPTKILAATSPGGGGDDTGERIARLGLSPRQQALNWLWSWYRCESYAARAVGWDGSPNVSPIEHEQISSVAYLPPGFTDAGSTYPVKFRKPTAPYALPKVIVDRFTGLLFSEARHPKLIVEGDPLTEDYLAAIAEAGRLWSKMISARQFGGATGTVLLGFKFVNGSIRFEVHDPRWAFPTWADREELTLSRVEFRSQEVVEQPNPETGVVEEVPYWNRRVIDAQRDIRFKPVPVGEGDEPRWEVESEVPHGLGFCPVVWIQNLPVVGDIDGDPDCQGIYDLVQTMDKNIAQADRGITANCDPTVVISSSGKLASVKTGNENAIKLPDGTATYLEATMSGPKEARAFAGELRTYALEVAQCVLDNPDSNNATATEIERRYASMLSKADEIREQYGEKGIKPLLRMVIKAIRKITTPQQNAQLGGISRGEVRLPPKLIKSPGPDGVEQVKRVARELPDEAEFAEIKLLWPPYFTPGIVDASQAADAANKAVLGQIIDKEHAANFVAPFFKVENVPAMLKKAKAEADEQANDLAMSGINQARALGAGAGGPQPVPQPGGAAPRPPGANGGPLGARPKVG